MKIIKTNTTKFLYVIAIIFIVITIAGAFYTRPTKFHKTFNNPISTTDLISVSSSPTIEIDGFITKRLSIKDFNKQIILNGKIKIDNKNYDLFAYNLGKATNYVVFGEVKENSNDMYPKYMLFLFDDYNSIYLTGFDSKHYIASPAKTIDDIKNLQTKLQRKN
ncbi:hypothetical protein [Thermobrachium celere]|uniref:hypothetical protein n=1 Tax=Thermobrachium celere TaxID=53422 RepID=UPI001942693C|nr:hypothetical protein [Thermobrachium celere]GFR36613.1 hypothetical protein TCEA9_24250 [Thermobrachium celere]